MPERLVAANLHRAAGHISSRQGFTSRRGKASLTSFDVRWWSAAWFLAADEQGTPVQFRDGPAAVTERESRNPLQEPLPIVCRGNGGDRREGPVSR
jgi:hypothetical protein